MTGRWERILESKPIPVIDHLVAEVGKLLAADLQKWPLPVEELDVQLEPTFAPLLLPDARRPEHKVFVEALRLVRWELSRQFDAYDDYMRNKRYLAANVVETDRPALLLISRYVVEQLLALGEATENRINRARMAQVTDHLETALNNARS